VGLRVYNFTQNYNVTQTRRQRRKVELTLWKKYAASTIRPRIPVDEAELIMARFLFPKGRLLLRVRWFLFIKFCGGKVLLGILLSLPQFFL
jgi:hypothetical protein